ncbi:MAG TPA: lytic transglycosylase domain-containing protein [Pyrinomonadaceae bacterium]|jgi:hypothetical protein|nr:lytic transglycosylase domain-containing protein [Pyrinomonadaceae bacterium]
MKTTSLIVAILLSLAVAASAQSGPRTFDNFDRSQGVPLYLPPPPPVPVSAKNSKRKGTKWQVAVKDNLVKKTVQSGATMSVTDGLAHRDVTIPFGGKVTMGVNLGLKGFTTGNIFHDSLIVESSRRYGVDPMLIYSQMHQESTFKTNATSPKGASGLMQLMPATARRFGVTQIYDPRQNVDAGVRYMRWLLDTFNGDVVLALAGYNAGEGAVMKYGWQVPPYRETQEYVRRILFRYSSITDSKYVHSIRRANGQIAQKESRPLTVYEPDAMAVKLANGKMMLVNQ